MTWQREYKTTGNGFAAFLFGFVLLFIGAVFSLLFGAAGLLVLLAGIVVPGLIWYLGKTVTITCHDQGFVVRTESRKDGTSVAEYGWHEVTATNYYEKSRRDAEGYSSTTRHFEVETVRGKAFNVTNKLRNMPELIQVFNSMAPQVPYVWQPRTGFTIQLGPATVSRGAYCSVPREQAQQQQG